MRNHETPDTNSLERTAPTLPRGAEDQVEQFDGIILLRVPVMPTLYRLLEIEDPLPPEQAS
jgi:hypothetical protein